jgi:hypothetical protein
MPLILLHFGPNLRQFPYLMPQWIGILSTEFPTTFSARLGLELDHLIALIGRNQITVMLRMAGLSSWPLLAPFGFRGFGLGVRML